MSPSDREERPEEPAVSRGARISVEENAAIGRRLLDILNDRDWDAHFELFAEDCVWEDVPSGSISRGPAELVRGTKAFVSPTFTWKRCG